jgi:hypothetical protein
MKADLERLSKLTSTLQNLAVTMAAVIGGLWSWGIFEHDNSIRQLKEQATLDIQVEARQLKLATRDARYIQGVVTIQNLGNRNTHLPLESKGIIVARVEPDLAGDIKFFDPVATGFYSHPAPSGIGEIVVHYGGINRLPFVVQVKEPGLYRVFFFVERSAADTSVAERGELTSGRSWKWTGGAYVVVE